MFPLTARKLLVQIYGQGPRIRHPGQVVVGGRALRLAILQGILNEMRNLGSNDLEHAQVVVGERIRLGLVERQYTYQSGNTLQGHSQGGAEFRGLFPFMHKTGIDLRVPIDDGSRVLRDPAAETCSRSEEHT